ncbi:hypothetical protein C5S36_00355 [Candidatus Methanophagaceae archaeon]|jgi:hypothetical protein|nr:hypothetical protein C5S36_00355 [Methanophagales archaeon]
MIKMFFSASEVLKDKIEITILRKNGVFITFGREEKSEKLLFRIPVLQINEFGEEERKRGRSMRKGKGGRSFYVYLREL